MKHVLLLAAMTLAGTATAKPLAFVKESGGFCPGRCPASSMTIDDNGSVIAEVQRFVPSPSTERKLLLLLNKDLVAAIKKDIQSLPAGSELVDLQEGQPICMDVPEVSYTVVKEGQTIQIGQDRNCHKYRLVNFQGSQLADILSSFLRLQSYASR